jgi:hypothetical protein
VNTATRLAGFAVGLVAVLGLGAATGAAVGPDRSAGTSATMRDMDDAAPTSRGDGVVSSVDGYRLVPVSAELAAGDFRFVIRGPGEVPVTQFVPTFDRELHLIVVNRELTSYHHVHPVLAADGTWSVALPSLSPGSYRAVADFHVADGPALALGVDLAVAGAYLPSQAPLPSTSSTVDGYDVALAAEVAADGEIAVALTVRRDGAVVRNLQPYLGASGHLVAMRTGDLAYLHVHPLSYADGTVRFAATLPSAGRYRLFFDFKHGDVVRTASFTYDQDAR